jgi:uncharacterized membrane protein YhiD involved in acid resistance
VSIIDALLRPSGTTPVDMFARLLLALLTGFIVGQLNAWCYMWTHRGISYSRSFPQGLVLITIVAALSMSLVAAKAIIAIGLMGGAAIIRFRTAVRDTRDTAYVFLCLICGMGAGFGFHEIAVIGAVMANFVAVCLYLGQFGAWYAADSLLRFRIRTLDLNTAALESVLSRFCRRCTVVSVDEVAVSDLDGETQCECAYKVRLRDPEHGPDLVAELRTRLHTDAVHLLIEQDYEEVV